MNGYKDFIKNIEKKNGYSLKVKGGDVGKPNEFNYSLVIIKKALVNYFVEGKSIYNTINENQDLIDYQIIKKRSAKTKYMIKDTRELLPDKVLRLFPVTKNGICIVTDTYKQVPDVPELAVCIKENIIGKTIKDVPNFDINYYITAFNDKLEQWTIGVADEENIDEDDEG